MYESCEGNSVPQNGNATQSDQEVADWAYKLLAPVELAQIYTSREIICKADAVMALGRSTVSFAEAGLEPETIEDVKAVLTEELMTNPNPDEWQKLPPAILALASDKIPVIDWLHEAISNRRLRLPENTDIAKLTYLQQLRQAAESDQPIG